MSSGRPRRSPAGPVLATGFVLVVLFATSCGGGAGGGGASAINAPVVIGFSPQVGRIDSDVLHQAPTYTDGMLTRAADPDHPGRIVITFRDDTVLDPASVFLGGRPELGLDLSALQVLHYVPGVGNVAVSLTSVEVSAAQIVIAPTGLPLANGQYSVGVYAGLRDVRGHPVQNAPVLHAFTVGLQDDVPPTVLGTSPEDGETGVGAGAPPPAGSDPGGLVADVRTSVFGPTTPDVHVRLNEPVMASSVTSGCLRVVNAGSPPAAGPPPVIAPAPGYPVLQSVLDGSVLPSNGQDVVWRADPLLGGFPFGTVVEVSLFGAYDTEEAANAGGPPDHASPVRDLTGNALRVTYTFSFQTIAPPDLPQNPFPQYAIWWSAGDRVGAIDTVNQQALAEQFTGVSSFPSGVPRNVLPSHTDEIATSKHVAGFSPTEISIDGRTNPTTCHTWIYVASPNSGEILIVDSRTSLPVAILQTPTPAGLSNQTGTGQAANVLLATNASANTLTTFDLSNVTPGKTFLDGPVIVGNVQPTGNNPRAVAISLSPTGLWSRDAGAGGPPVPLILYVDASDGVLNTTRLGESGPVRQIALGVSSSPNDVAMTPCFGSTPVLVAAVSYGAGPGEGRIGYYVSGPGCQTGASTGSRPDDLVGTLAGFEAPAGLDEVWSVGNGSYFVVAESGAGANRVSVLGVETGATNLPRVMARYQGVGANPVAVAHRASWISPPRMALAGSGTVAPNPSCWYAGTEQYVFVSGCAPQGLWDCTLAAGQDLYVCAKGAGQVSVVNLITGAPDLYSPIRIPGVGFVAGPPTQ